MTHCPPLARHCQGGGNAGFSLPAICPPSAIVAGMAAVDQDPTAVQRFMDIYGYFCGYALRLWVTHGWISPKLAA